MGGRKGRTKKEGMNEGGKEEGRKAGRGGREGGREEGREGGREERRDGEYRRRDVRGRARTADAQGSNDMRATGTGDRPPKP